MSTWQRPEQAEHNIWPLQSSVANEPPQPVVSTLPPPPSSPPGPGHQPAPVSNQASYCAPAPQPSRPIPTNTVVTVLDIDDVESAHQAAFDIALDACNLGRSVAHLHADPATQSIHVGPDGSHDLGNAIRSIPTASGRLIRVDIGGLTRLQVVDVLSSVQPLVDQVILSGPGSALTQLSLEFAVIADSAVCCGGSPADRQHLSRILSQLGVTHRQGSMSSDPTLGDSPEVRPAEVRPAEVQRKITPPGRV